MKSLRMAILLVLAGGLVTYMLLVRHRHAAAERNTQTVMVTFEGPWAFAADPSDDASIYAFAPKTMTHHDLVVKSSGSEGEVLDAGVYEVLLHAIPKTRRDTAIDSRVLQAKIDAQGVEHALADRLDRYAIRLPRPEAYVAGATGRMRADTAYPPRPSTENNYAMDVALRYSATTLAGFTVIGSPDRGGAFHPVLVNTPNLSFAIRPLDGQQMDECELHNREAFRDLAKLVNLKLFVDFGNFTSGCHATDPQNPSVAVSH